MASFDITQDRVGEYRFRLTADNGEVIASGDGYTTKSGVLNGIDSLKRAAAKAAIKIETDQPGGANPRPA